MPCVYDGLTARLVARAGFEATFMTGFGVSAVHGLPDTQLISYQEMETACRVVAEGLASAALEQKVGNNNHNCPPPIPCIADGDTGYGNAVNVKRTLMGYGRAGMAGIMIEDQVSPKRCGHVVEKSVISFPEAVQRM
jgi:2-methylisocitrate lyase-like PEP mutase family enzyme